MMVVLFIVFLFLEAYPQGASAARVGYYYEDGDYIIMPKGMRATTLSSSRSLKTERIIL